jgi:hypothetical protein
MVWMLQWTAEWSLGRDDILSYEKLFLTQPHIIPLRAQKSLSILDTPLNSLIPEHQMMKLLLHHVPC